MTLPFSPSCTKYYFRREKIGVSTAIFQKNELKHVNQQQTSHIRVSVGQRYGISHYAQQREI